MQTPLQEQYTLKELKDGFFNLYFKDEKVGSVALSSKGRVWAFYTAPEHENMRETLLKSIGYYAKKEGFDCIEIKTKDYEIAKRWGWEDAGFIHNLISFFTGSRKLKLRL